MYRFTSILVALALCALFPLDAASQIYSLPHADTSAASGFGSAVALGDSLAVVGASGEDVCGENSGAVYVYQPDTERPGRNWEQTARLTAENCQPGKFFGRSLSVDGNRILIGASTEFFAEVRPSAAFVFEQDENGNWKQSARLTTSQQTGESLSGSVHLDGNRALVTTQGSTTGESNPRGSALIFEYDAEKDRWERRTRLFGSRNAPTTFGASGVLEGNTAVISAPSNRGDDRGALYFFEQGENGSWRQAARFDGLAGFHISLDIDNGTVVAGEGGAGNENEGRVSLFARNANGEWERKMGLQPSIPYGSGSFGMEVSLHQNHLLATGYDEQLQMDFNIDRVVFAFKQPNSDGRWEQSQMIDIGEVDFATAIDHFGDQAIVGHVRDDAPGKAYIIGLH